MRLEVVAGEVVVRQFRVQLRGVRGDSVAFDPRGLVSGGAGFGPRSSAAFAPAASSFVRTHASKANRDWPTDS